MSKADDIVLVGLAQDIIAIAEDYDTYMNLIEEKDDFAERVIERLEKYGVNLG